MVSGAMVPRTLPEPTASRCQIIAVSAASAAVAPAHASVTSAGCPSARKRCSSWSCLSSSALAAALSPVFSASVASVTCAWYSQLFGPRSRRRRS